MSNKQFISNLSATYADVRRLDVKKINLKGKNILEYIKENKTVILDERGTKADDELDIWNSYVTTDENGNVIINRDAKPKEHTYKEMTDEQKELLLNSAAKVIDNEVLDTNGNHLMYWQTSGLTDALDTVDKDDDGEDDAELSVFCHYDYWDGELSNSNLTTFSSDLSNLWSGYMMFMYCSNLTTFSSDLSSMTDGVNMFSNCTALTTFSADLSSLQYGDSMFKSCSELTSFSSDLSSLMYGRYMFDSCTNLTTFSSDLSSLTDGVNMFFYCPNLTTFSADLSSLTEGEGMFYYCQNLESFSSDLSSLQNGGGMFYECSNLTTFSSDLSSMTNGYNMFCYCYNLTSFTSDLSSLQNGGYMFDGCKLDAPSVANIVHMIKDTYNGDVLEPMTNITIGIGIPNTDEAKQAFAEECYCDDWDELNQEFDDKNWAVQWQFNGEATTFDLRSPRPSTAVFASLEEVIMPTNEKERKPHYKYTSQDGSKFYNIHWYHNSNTNNEGFDYFESLEEAISAYGVIPKV